MSVTPYLTLADASAAIDFYEKAFGAVEQFRLPANDGKKIMHAVLQIAGGTIFLSDMGPSERPASVAVALGLDGAQAVDALAARVAEAGHHHLRAAGHVLGRPVRRAHRSVRSSMDPERAEGLRRIACSICC